MGAEGAETAHEHSTEEAAKRPVQRFNPFNQSGGDKERESVGGVWKERKAEISLKREQTRRRRADVAAGGAAEHCSARREGQKRRVVQGKMSLAI